MKAGRIFLAFGVLEVERCILFDWINWLESSFFEIWLKRKITHSVNDNGGVGMAVRQILMLGDARLHEIAKKVDKRELSEMKSAATDLHDTMMQFRQKHGWGRAIAAPQIGVMKRLILICVDQPLVLMNPEITFQSEELMELWDDCMSFPDLLVKVKRHKACRVKYRDLDWKEHEMAFDNHMSELFQHEYDHLDGILAVSRAVDGKSFALTCAKEKIRIQPNLT